VPRSSLIDESAKRESRLRIHNLDHILICCFAPALLCGSQIRVLNLFLGGTRTQIIRPPNPIAERTSPSPQGIAAADFRPTPTAVPPRIESQESGIGSRNPPFSRKTSTIAEEDVTIRSFFFFPAAEQAVAHLLFPLFRARTRSISGSAIGLETPR